MEQPTGQSLAGRVALVTGVSRRIGIGSAVARRLLSDGAAVFASGFEPHDAEMPWETDPGGALTELARHEAAPDRLHHEAADLEDPAAPDRLVAATVARFGRIDIVVANHARSSSQSFEEVTARELDKCWAINARASLLLARSLYERRPRGPGGRLVLFTSGQHIGPMAGEIAYAVSKGAIHQMTASLADALVDRGVTVNCINPGPTDTGYAKGRAHETIARMFPAGRWGSPEDVANLVAWLVCDEAAWITGQVIVSEGGFRRWARVARDG
jgi:3-oxoacyl-[acyl-carrier protein] reductase